MQENYQSYLEYYVENIKPAINTLDIAIKCKSKLSNKELAEILGSSEQEVEKIRAKHKLRALNQKALMIIMQESSSTICEIFQRELELGSPFTYTREQFAYIYDFDINLINSICEQLNIYEITWQNMPMVFGSLPYRDMSCND